jgi:agmatinase
MNKFLDEEYSCHTIEDAAVIILPIPYEFSTSYGKGTVDGPNAILQASPYLEFYDEELDFEPWQAGIYTADPLSVMEQKPERAMNTIKDTTLTLLDLNKFIVSLGGEHSISYGIYSAFHTKYDDLCILQLDAHSDLRDEYMGSKYNHACVMRRIWEMNNNIIQVGIRAQCIEERQFILQHQIKTYYASNLHESGFTQEIINQLTNNIYLTIDVDFFDPSILPSTGTPEPGGFQWYETIEFIKKIFSQKNVVGVDIVELSPQKNLIHPDFTIAKLVYKLIALKVLKGESDL